MSTSLTVLVDTRLSLFLASLSRPVVLTLGSLSPFLLVIGAEDLMAMLLPTKSTSKLIEPSTLPSKEEDIVSSISSLLPLSYWLPASL